MSLLREYQVVYRRCSPHGPQGEPGPVETVTVAARTEAAAEEIFAGQSDIQILATTEIRALLDWSQDVFTLEEAGEFIRGTVKKVRVAVDAGELPKAKDRHPLYTRARLLRFIEENMEESPAYSRHLAGGATRRTAA